MSHGWQDEARETREQTHLVAAHKKVAVPPRPPPPLPILAEYVPAVALLLRLRFRARIELVKQLVGVEIYNLQRVNQRIL